ncbi:hypothetical protein COB18_02600 [Candidatus Kaiserbacteria bacterium]|nr:MAG: hypothetical protein COB18_02600 [Candidatus Kaiserbacteria bacterium]
MDQELQKKLDTQDAKLNAIYVSVEKTRKYFLLIIWGSVIAVVLPIIGLMVVIPKFIGSYLGALDGLL